MIISAELVRRPRKLRRCETCGAAMLTDSVRLYGAAYRGDPPYRIYICLTCAERSNDKKTLAAIKPSN